MVSSDSSDSSDSDGSSSDSSSSSSDSEEGKVGEYDENQDNANEDSIVNENNEENSTEKEASESALEVVSPPTTGTTILSKSWAIREQHVPIYTGGKITLAHNNVGKNSPFLLLPVDGDVALVDSCSGVRLSTVRESIQGSDASEDDDEGFDADAVTAYALSWNDCHIITCSQNSLVRQYSIKRNVSTQDAAASKSSSLSTTPSSPFSIELVKTWGKSGHTLLVTEIKFHCSNTFVATGSVDGSVRIWDVRGCYVTHVFRPVASTDNSGGGGSGTLAVTAVQWMENLQKLVVAIGRDDGSVTIHDLRDSNKNNINASNTIVLRNHMSAVTCLNWTSDFSLFITAGRDEVLNLWTMNSLDEDEKMKETKMSRKRKAVATTPSPRYRNDHTLPIYEQIEGMVVLTDNLSGDNCSFQIMTAGSKGRVRVYKTVQSTDTGKFAFKQIAEQNQEEAFGEARGGYLDLKLNPVSHLQSAEKGSSSAVKEQVVVADAEHNISFLSFSCTQKGEDNLLCTYQTWPGHNDDILDLKVIPGDNRQRIAVATNSSQVRIFELGTFSCQVLEDQHTATVLCVDVSPCGRYLGTCGKDKQMRLWHLAEGNKCVALATGHTEAIGSTALSKKIGKYEVGGKAAKNGGGAFCVTVSRDRTLKRWNLPGPEELDSAAKNSDELSLKASVSARAHEKDINIVSVAPNDSLIATGSQDKTVKLWKSTDLSLKATLKGHRRGVWDCQFSPLDRVLATASGDKTIKLWSLSDYGCVRTFQGHVASVLRVRFLSGGLQLASSGADGLVKLWTVRTNECVSTMDAHNDKVWALDLSSSNRTMISAGADSRIVVWEDTTKEDLEVEQAAKEEALLMNQRLANHLRNKEYAEALEIALERDKPHQALAVFTSIVEEAAQEGQNNLETLKKHVANWSTDRLLNVLRYCREWNTRARNSHMALLVVKAIVATVPAHKLATTEGVPEVLAGIVPYAERHFDRLDRLCASSYLLDFALFAMGSLDTTDTEKEFAAWMSTSKLVLPPKHVDGRVQVGGNAVIGPAKIIDDDDEVLTVGDSDSDEDDDSEADNINSDDGGSSDDSSENSGDGSDD